jgi:predicted DNA-binding transcriptional regulator YafY
MSSLDRLDRLAELLRTRRGYAARDLAAALGVSVRSISRDLRRLRSQGLQIEGRRGRSGGVGLDRQWCASHILLSADDVVRVLLALSIAEQLTLPFAAAATTPLRDTITGALLERDRARLATIAQRVFVGPAAPASIRSAYTPPSPEALAPLEVGFVEARAVIAEYKRQRDERTVRRIEPHGLVVNWPAWYLLAYDHPARRGSAIRLDRLTRVTLTIRRFQPAPNELARALLDDNLIPHRWR